MGVRIQEENPSRAPPVCRAQHGADLCWGLMTNSIRASQTFATCPHLLPAPNSGLFVGQTAEECQAGGPPSPPHVPLPHTPTAHRSTPVSHRRFSWCPAHPRSWRARSHLGDTQGGVRLMGAHQAGKPRGAAPLLSTHRSSGERRGTGLHTAGSPASGPGAPLHSHANTAGMGGGKALAGQRRKDVSRSEFPFLKPICCHGNPISRLRGSDLPQTARLWACSDAPRPTAMPPNHNGDTETLPTQPPGSA